MLIFLLGMTISGYFLLQLGSDLSLETGIISTAELPAAAPIFQRLQLAVFSTFVIGLIGFYAIQRRHQRELIYVEKTREAEKSKQQVDDENEKTGHDKLAAEVSRILKSEKSRGLEKAFHSLCNAQEAVAGALYTITGEDKNRLELEIPFALSFGDSQRPVYEFGDGFVGQSAKDRKALFIDNIPNYDQHALSGLGSSPPRFLSVVPLIHEDELVGICELGTFRTLEEADRQTLERACQTLAGHMTGRNGKNPEKTSKS